VRTVKAANAAFRFLLELCALLAIGYWGFASADGVKAVVRGLGVPLLMIAVWGTFGAPGAPLRAAAPMRLALLAVIYGWAVAALASIGQLVLAIALGAAVVVNTVLLYALGQE
jgi:Protein of unknown function (DUF2568)